MNRPSRAERLWFGIPDIDGLMRDPEDASSASPAENLKEPKGSGGSTGGGSVSPTTVMCIQGPVGSGKSTLALHLAACYASMTKQDEVEPVILFLSTDWRTEDAGALWRQFNLGGFPNRREWGWASHEGYLGRQTMTAHVRNTLSPLTIGGSESAEDLVNWLAAPRSEGKGPSRVGFLDLSRFELGDEWTFLERLLGHVTSLRNAREEGHGRPHLVIVDSIPGLETASGSRDVFGQTVSTQERINRMIHILRHSAHLVFTSGYDESAEVARREEAQADIALRLNLSVRNGVPVRTVQVTKARGYDHSLEAHPMEFVTSMTFSSQSADLDVKPIGNSYVQVYPSMQWLMASVKRYNKGRLPEPAAARERSAPLAACGVKYLDNMLLGHVTFDERNPGSDWSREMLKVGDRYGLPCGSLTKITGPEQTYKSVLAFAFARHGFAIYARYALALLEGVLWLPGRPLLRQTVGSVVEVWNEIRLEWQSRLRESNEIPKDFAELLEEIFEPGKAPSGTPYPQNHANRIKARAEFILELGRRCFPEPKDPAGGAGPEDLGQSLIRTVWRLLSRFGPKRRVLLITTRYFDVEDTFLGAGKYLTTAYELSLQRIAKRMHEYMLLKGDFGSARDNLLGEFQRGACEFVIKKRLHYRRLIPRDLLPEVLFHVIRRNVEAVLQQEELDGTLPDQKGFWLDRIKARQAPSDVGPDPEELSSVRVIVDDLQAAQIACAGHDHEYASFCSLLTTYLRLRGVTSLLVESDGTRPTASGTPAGKPERSHTIRTSRVRIEGADRVAITVEPAFHPDLHGCLRELKVKKGDGSEEMALVDPSFELYSNLGSGSPVLIPLEVHLLAETENIASYCQTENAFLGTFFKGGAIDDPGGARVIRQRTPLEYDLLKDMATYPNPVTTVPKTVVIQVDGYWNLARSGNLRNLADYLFRDVTAGVAEERQYEDQFGKFNTKGASIGMTRFDPYRWSEAKGSALRYICRISKNDRRIDRVPYTWDYGFLLIDYPAWRRALENRQAAGKLKDGRRGSTSADEVMRVLLYVEQQCGGHGGDAGIAGTPRRFDGKSGAGKGAGVAGTRNSSTTAGPEPVDAPSWRDFAVAAKWVADLEQQRASAAREDVIVSGLATGNRRPSSLDCLVLEMWISEIYSLLRRESGGREGPGSGVKDLLLQLSAPEYGPREAGTGKTADPLERNGLLALLLAKDQGRSTRTRFQGLLDALGKGGRRGDLRKRLQADLRGSYALQLYKTWLLLLECFDINSYLPRISRLAPPQGAEGPRRHAVAVRHWYKSACTASSLNQPETERRDWRVLRLPGHFSTRGDWYLGILRGSRSIRLGELALDLLTDEQANVERLRMGVGLPVRDIRPEGRTLNHAGTGLLTRDSNGVPRPATLGEFLDATVATSFAEESDRIKNEARVRTSVSGSGFFWLWRSGLGAYDHHCASFRAWIRGLMQWTVGYHVQNLASWDGAGGREAYDAITNIERIAFDGPGPVSESDLEILGKAKDLLGRYRSFREFAELCDDLVERLNHVTPPTGDLADRGPDEPVPSDSDRDSASARAG